MAANLGVRVETCHKLSSTGKGILETIASGLSEIAILMRIIGTAQGLWLPLFD